MKLFGAAETPVLETREQAINLVKEHIAALDLQLDAYPGPYDPVNSAVYLKWERMLMCWIGRVTESLCWMRALEIVSPEIVAKLEQQAQMKITSASAKMILEGRRS